jgi:hypothetical protein
MSKLLLFIGESEKFNKDEVINKISAIDGVVNAKSGNFIGAVFECDYQSEGVSTTVRLSDDFETITVEGQGDESLKFVLKLKEVLAQAISMVDMDYSFHFELASIGTVAELKQKMNEGL